MNLLGSAIEEPELSGEDLNTPLNLLHSISRNGGFSDNQLLVRSIWGSWVEKVSFPSAYSVGGRGRKYNCTREVHRVKARIGDESYREQILQSHL